MIAFTIVVDLLSRIAKLQEQDVWLWIITILSFGGLLAVSLLYLKNEIGSRRKLRAFTEELHTKEALLGLDDSLLRLITRLLEAKDVNAEMHRIIQKLLYDATELFTPKVRRGLLLRSDAALEYLLISDYYGWLDQIDQKKFYIGRAVPGLQRGIAGEAFITANIVIAHVQVDKNGTWKCEKQSYISFEEDGAAPSHRSLICAPVVIGSRPNDRLGVICFDSTDPQAFDSVRAKEVLKLLSRRIAALLLIYQELQGARST